VARYILLRVQDNHDADQLLADLVLSNDEPLLSPGMQHPVRVELACCIRDIDDGMQRDGAIPFKSISLRVRDSYDRAQELAYEWSRPSANSREPA
jgi:hypothetical protein